MAKFDISDGFYCLFLDPDNAPKLAVQMPKYDGEPQLVAVPLSLTMRWVSSPPTFCAASETATDIANASLFRHTMPPHRLKDAASTHDCWGPPPHPDLGPQPPFSPPTTKPISALALPFHNLRTMPCNLLPPSWSLQSLHRLCCNLKIMSR